MSLSPDAKAAGLHADRLLLRFIIENTPEVEEIGARELPAGENPDAAKYWSTALTLALARIAFARIGDAAAGEAFADAVRSDFMASVQIVRDAQTRRAADATVVDPSIRFWGTNP